jgi:3-methyladenine DNA glycosylase AlkD
LASSVQILSQLRKLANPDNAAGMARFGITSRRVYGVPSTALRAIARAAGRDGNLASRLWDSGVYEARILAAYVADPRGLTRREMDRWAREFDSWALCDNTCIHLFRKTAFAWDRAIRWSSRRQEFVKRAGFALMATLAVHDKQAGDEAFLSLLPILEREARDPRNFVKKAVNWALRQIGKRNPTLRGKAMETAARLKASEFPSARWIGSDALRELKTKP